MGNQEWIGIQFNFEANEDCREILGKYSDIEVQQEHLRANFSNKELKKAKTELVSKVNFLQKAIQKCIAESSYTNHYTYLDASSLISQKDNYLNGDYKESIRFTEIPQNGTLLELYKTKIKAVPILTILRKDPSMNVMEQLFQFIKKRDFALDQKLTIEFTYEDKDEWGQDRDYLNISIQLDK